MPKPILSSSIKLVLAINDILILANGKKSKGTKGIKYLYLP